VHTDPADDPHDDRVHSHFASTALKLLPVVPASAAAAAAPVSGAGAPGAAADAVS
jgi:hypothetical protein